MSGCGFGRSWPNVSMRAAARIHTFLREKGWGDLSTNEAAEAWRVRRSATTITYETRRGTLYTSGSRDSDPEVTEACEVIDGLTPPRFAPPNRSLLIGLDEANTRQVVGPAVAVGVMIPLRLAAAIRDIVETAATKKKSVPSAYWERRYRCLADLVNEGLQFHVEEIAPAACTNSSTHPLLGAAYQKLLSLLLLDVSLGACQVVVDDFGIKGTPLAHTLNDLAAKGVETVIEPRADDHYLAARTASVIARWERVRLLEELRQNPEYEVIGLTVPAGTAGSRSAKAWLDAWESSHRPWPWFVKKSVRESRAAATPLA